ncbi:MAG TPA: LysM peptidoglycan-binding domain-containing protein [Anaerolineae bacterium]|nr:LysM peptidoglycan-binding domain-containing protein [Anaerolineae bacterium]
MSRRRHILLVLILTVTLWVAVAVPSAADSPVHIVQRGDTLSGIAARHGVSVTALMQTNGLQNADFIWYGQKLTIPGMSSPAPVSSATVYVVQRGDTLSSIAVRHGVSLVALAQANSITNSNWIYVGQRLSIPSSGAGPSPSTGAAKTHRVQAGEHLSVIAARYGTTAAAIAAVNGIANPSLIYAGQLLTIPGAGSWSPAAPAGSGLSFVVYISQQHCYLYRDGTQLYSWACSTGRSGAGTLTGTFHVQSKIRNAWGSRFNAWMPYWLGIYWAGSTENGIHGLPIDASSGVTWWADRVGTPITFGCIMLSNDAAITLYNLAYIGMTVTIRP